MRRLAILTTLILAACGPAFQATPAPTATPARTPKADSVDNYVRIYGGLAGAYRSILAETSCTALQDELYTATDNKTVGFQAAIVDRAQDLGCAELRFTRP